jgi:hypothetical protein
MKRSLNEMKRQLKSDRRHPVIEVDKSRPAQMEVHSGCALRSKATVDPHDQFSPRQSKLIDPRN